MACGKVHCSLQSGTENFQKTFFSGIRTELCLRDPLLKKHRHVRSSIWSAMSPSSSTSSFTVVCSHQKRNANPTETEINVASRNSSRKRTALRKLGSFFRSVFFSFFFSPAHSQSSSAPRLMGFLGKRWVKNARFYGILCNMTWQPDLTSAKTSFK